MALYLTPAMCEFFLVRYLLWFKLARIWSEFLSLSLSLFYSNKISSLFPPLHRVIYFSLSSARSVGWIWPEWVLSQTNLSATPRRRRSQDFRGRSIVDPFVDPSRHVFLEYVSQFKAAPVYYYILHELLILEPHHRTPRKPLIKVIRKFFKA